MAECTSNLASPDQPSVRVLLRQHAHERARDEAACAIVPRTCEDCEVQIFEGEDRNGVVCSTRSSSPFRVDKSASSGSRGGMSRGGILAGHSFTWGVNCLPGQLPPTAQQLNCLP